MSEPEKPIHKLSKTEVQGLLQAVGGNLKQVLPGQLWCLLVFSEEGIGQYVSNADRPGVIAAMREFADLLEANEVTPTPGSPEW
jgi:hypothetical protein